MSTKTNGKPRRLGRGLSSLMGPAPVPVAAPERAEAAEGEGGPGSRAGRGPGDDSAASAAGGPKLDAGQARERSSGRPGPGRAMAVAPAGASGGGDTGREDHGEPGGPDERPPAAGEATGFRRLPVESIDRSPFQPRQTFDEGSLRQLADSIVRSGMMQPIVVRPAGTPTVPGGLPSAGGHGARGSSGGAARAGGGDAERFELVAGERRLRAAKLAGLSDVPAIVRKVDDESAAELALVENLQREDLNAIERARALRALCERFELTHAQVAERVGLERSSVTNLVRLLELEGEIVELLAQGMLGQGHGKALLSAPAGTGRIALAARAVREEWSVRRLEQEARGSGGAAGSAHGPAPAKGGPDRPASLSELERQLSEHLGTKVRIAANSKGDRGRVTIEFYSLDHFDGLMGKMGFGMEG